MLDQETALGMKPLIIIPARGGSKGIPRKNIKSLNGRPLIAYSIDVAKEFAANHGLAAERIILSTDDDEIAGVAEECGLKVPYRRPASLATDTAGSREVILDTMDYADRNKMAYDCVLLLQPTSPLRSLGDVEGCMNLFYAKKPDMAVSVKEASANPYYNCFEADLADGTLHISKGDGRLTRRQDAPKAWEFNGAVYAINPASIRLMPMGEFPVRIPYYMPAERSVDLDTPLDWAIAEAIMNENANNE